MSIKPPQSKPGSSNPLRYRGFESSHQNVDHRRMKFGKIKAPRGVNLTDKMYDEVLQAVCKTSGVQTARLTQDGDLLVTLRKVRSASKTIALARQLVSVLWRLIVDTLVNECRKVKRKVKQSTAKQRRTSSFVNDKTKTQPALATT